MTSRAAGQSAVEFLVCASLLTLALFVPWFEGASAGSLLARRIAQTFHALHALIAQL